VVKLVEKYRTQFNHRKGEETPNKK